MPARYEGTETWQRERPFLISFASQNEELTTDDLALSVAVSRDSARLAFPCEKAHKTIVCLNLIQKLSS